MAGVSARELPIPRRRPPFATTGIRGWAHLTWDLPDDTDCVGECVKLRAWSATHGVEVEFEDVPGSKERQIDVAAEGRDRDAFMAAWPGFHLTGT